MPNDDSSAQLAAIENVLGTVVERDKIIELRFAHLATSLDALTQSNIKMNESVGELLMTQLTIRGDLGKIEELQTVKNEGFVTSIKDIEGRVRTIEQHNAINHGERRNSDKTRAWWGDNWYKILGVGILCIPLIDFLYERVTGDYDEHKGAIERSKDNPTISTKP